MVVRPLSPPAVQPPVVVVLGDSTALTLGLALQATAPAGTTVVQGGHFGCGLAIGTWASDTTVPMEAMFPACNSTKPASQQWPALAVSEVEGTAPGDVVLFVAGAWECEDILHNGQWSNITQPAFQQYLLDQMRLAVVIATAHGARLDFTTMPAMDNGTIGDMPIRRVIYNQLVDEVASQDPGQVGIVDLGDLLSPGGVYTQYIDGVQVRTADGLHTPSYDPGNAFLDNSSEAVADAFEQWLAPRIWPMIIGTNHPTRPPEPLAPMVARENA